MRRRVKLPIVQCSGAFEPQSLDAEKRTVEMIWRTSRPVLRSSFLDGDYMLEMPLDPKSVRMERLRSGNAPLLANHDGSLDAVLGVIETATVDGKVGRATARFSERPEAHAIFRDVQAGILRAVSVGARIHRLEEVRRGKGDELPVFRATDWEPLEISLVAVNGDPGAVVLAEDPRAHECRLTLFDHGGSKMTTDDDRDDLDRDDDADEKPKTKAELAAENRELRRCDRIRNLARHFESGDLFAKRHIDLGTSADEAMRLAAEERARRAPPTRNHIDFEADYDSPAYQVEQMAAAIAHRANPKLSELPPEARRHANISFAEAAYEMLRLRGGYHRGLDLRRDEGRIVQLALSSSDFPNILANVATKILKPAYEQAAPVYRLLARRQDLPDFKTASVLKVGDFPIPIQVGEEGEIQLGKFSEAKDTFALVSYGRRLLFSLQMLVNDDASAFAQVLEGAARRLADFENMLWFTSLISAAGAGPTLGDGGALFNATAVSTPGGHANLTGTGTAISGDSLGVGIAAMMKQVSLDGIKINVPPRFLVTSPDKLGLARQYTTVLGPNLAASSQNPWAGMLEPLADANLVSANPWYLFSDPARSAVSVYGYLAGSAGPQIATRQGFEVLGTEMRVALHFGFAFVDFRGAYRNAGA